MDRNTNKWDLRFLNLAKHISSWSKDPSSKVGAAIVRTDKTIASLGYNGLPKYMKDIDSYYEKRDEKYSRIIHAEINALIHSKEDVTGYTLYTYPMMPCDRCIVHMSQAGITRVVSPKATEEKLLRWKDSFEKTEKYAKECNITLDIIYFT